MYSIKWMGNNNCLTTCTMKPWYSLMNSMVRSGCRPHCDAEKPCKVYSRYLEAVLTSWWMTRNHEISIDGTWALTTNWSLSYKWGECGDWLNFSTWNAKRSSSQSQCWHRIRSNFNSRYCHSQVWQWTACPGKSPMFPLFQIPRSSNLKAPIMYDRILFGIFIIGIGCWRDMKGKYIPLNLVPTGNESPPLHLIEIFVRWVSKSINHRRV